MQDTNNKIFSLDSKRLGALSNDKDDIALCYGHFNLIHPGHLRYLRHAKTLANKLIVAIVSDKDLAKNTKEHYFHEKERAESIANIQCVDNVVILNNLSLARLVEALKPKALVLGREFEDKQPKQISSAINLMKSSGEVVFHAGETHYATSDLLHDNVFDIEKNNRNKFNKICQKYDITLKKIQARLANFSNTKLLVIGDTIVDHYVACDAIGMSAEAPVLVVKELENREFIGGAAIVASHVRSLGSNCHYISVVGEDSQASLVSETLNNQGIKTDLFSDSSRPTTYKTRYIVENQKLFRVSRIKDHKISKEIEDKIIKKITLLAPKLDGIMISDFVYGVITNKILESITKLSEQFGFKLYGDLQCSSQVGKVSKFSGFDLITPTEKESRIALEDNESGIEWIANTLMNNTNSKNMLIKLGSDGFIAYGNTKSSIERQNFPALVVNPVDVTGAGDSLFAAMSVSLSSGASLIEASVIGVCMASLAVKEVGNTAITKENLGNCIADILN